MLRKILLLLLIIFIVIQFFRPAKNINAGPQLNSIAKVYSYPVNVHHIMERACLDCHSNNTKYPWYSQVQPVAWWLNGHVLEGKQKVNFDEFLTYEPKKQDHKMEETIEMIEKKEMPLNSYTWGHREAKLTDAERSSLVTWARQVRKEITVRTGFGTNTTDLENDERGTEDKSGKGRGRNRGGE